MLVVKLERYTFKDDPEWVIVEENIPLGTIYFILGQASNMTIVNEGLKKQRIIDVYMVTRDGDNQAGWLPVDVFSEPIAVVESWQKSTSIN